MNVSLKKTKPTNNHKILSEAKNTEEGAVRTQRKEILKAEPVWLEASQGQPGSLWPVVRDTHFPAQRRA